MVNVALYIQYGRYSQQADANINSMKQVLKGGMPVQKYVRLLFIVRRAVEWMYGMNPTEPTLDQTANYLYALSGQRNLTVTPPVSPFTIIVQPSSQSVNEGDNVSFIVQAIGGTEPYSYQWAFNGTPISGETNQTLSLTSVDSGDAGSYSVTITDDEGQILTSQNATLTVNLGTVAVFYAASITDPFPLTVDGYSYTSQNITPGANISWNLNNAYQNQFIIFKEPVTEPVKLLWYNTALNNGNFPDSVYRAPVVLGSFRYYLSRIEYAWDNSQPTILSS